MTFPLKYKHMYNVYPRVKKKKNLKDRQPTSMPWEREMLCLSYTFIFVKKSLHWALLK